MKKKTEFHDLSPASILGWTLTWAVMIFGWVAVGQPLTNANTQGRVHMQLEDLKTVMALDARHPSAENAAGEWNVSGLVQEELGSASTLVVTMNADEKARLTQKIAKLEQTQESEIAKAEKEFETTVASIKEKRRELQIKRLNSGTEKSDSETSKRIFENVLEEANLAAFRDTKISDIKEHTVVTVLFRSDADGVRKIESIVAGNATLWGHTAASVVALRK
jgi:hypothetical protein